MVTKQTLIGQLPPFRNEKRLIKHRQNTDNIIDEILNTHDEYLGDYDRIYTYFDDTNPESAAREIFNFCKRNLTYTIESEEDQTVKSPAAILSPGEKTDCKHYALFIGGILDAIKRNEEPNLNWFYRFASYSNDRNIEHVFVVVTVKGKEIWVDPVLNFFNEKRIPTYYIDEYPMALYKVSGIGSQSVGVTVESTEQANQAFLTWITFDLFAMKTLLKSNMDITNTVVKTWYQQNGLDFNQLLNFLNS